MDRNPSCKWSSRSPPGRHFIEHVIDSISSFSNVVKTAISLTNRANLGFFSYSAEPAKSHNCCDGKVCPSNGEKLALKLDLPDG